MFRVVLFFIVVAIGMVLEPRHLDGGSTYFCGAEGISLSRNFKKSLGFLKTSYLKVWYQSYFLCEKNTISNTAFQFVYGLNFSITRGKSIWGKNLNLTFWENKPYSNFLNFLLKIKNKENYIIPPRVWGWSHIKPWISNGFN